MNVEEHYYRGWNCAIKGVSITNFWSEAARKGFYEALAAPYELFVPYLTRNEERVEEAYYGNYSPAIGDLERR